MILYRPILQSRRDGSYKTNSRLFTHDYLGRSWFNAMYDRHSYLEETTRLNCEKLGTKYEKKEFGFRLIGFEMVEIRNE